MRISGGVINHHDLDVYLDGVKVDFCFEADEELGKVYYYDTDKNGNFYEDHTGKLAYSCKTGKVEIRKKQQKKNIEIDGKDIHPAVSKSPYYTLSSTDRVLQLEMNYSSDMFEMNLKISSKLPTQDMNRFQNDLMKVFQNYEKGNTP